MGLYDRSREVAHSIKLRREYRKCHVAMNSVFAFMTRKGWLPPGVLCWDGTAQGLNHIFVHHLKQHPQLTIRIKLHQAWICFPAQCYIGRVEQEKLHGNFVLEFKSTMFVWVVASRVLTAGAQFAINVHIFNHQVSGFLSQSLS